MGTFAVTVGKAEYEVDARDEAEAWKLANQEHSQVKPFDIPSWQASLMNVGQALSFGFGDEIAGALGQDKARYRATVDQFRKEYPGSAALGTVAGSMALPFGAAKLPFAAASPWKTAASMGLMTGAAQGFGDSPSMEAAPNDAARSGLMGMVAAPLVMSGITKGGDVGSALAARYLPNWAKSVARRRVATAIDRDGMDVVDVERRMAELGPEARVADAAGENTRGVLDLNANLPGRTMNSLEATIRNRQATRPDRLDDVVYAVHGGRGRAGAVSEALTAQQKGQAGPLYAKAHAMDVDPTPQLVRDVEAARKLGAFSEAEKRALANPDGGPFSLDPAQQVLGNGKISVRDMDHIKQGLDSLIEKQTDATTGKVSSYGRDLIGLKKRIIGEVDNLTIDPKTGKSVYAAARDAYAGPAALKSAIERGRKFWSDSGEKLADTMEGLTKSEQQAFRIGAAESLRERVGGPRGQNELLNMWKNRNIRERFQELLGDDVKYSDVKRMIDNEAVLKQLESLGPSRNSRTFSREAAAEDQGLGVAADMLDLGIAAKTGAIPGMTRIAGRQLSRMATPEPVRDAMGDVLLQQYLPAEMKALMVAQEIIRRQRALASTTSGTAAGKAATGLFPKE